MAELKADPGRVRRDTMAAELAKLARVRSLELPTGLFDGWSERLVAAWRARAATEYPSDLRSHPQPVRLTRWRRCAGCARVNSSTGSSTC